MWLQAGSWKPERSHKIHVPITQGINPVSAVLMHLPVLCSLMVSPEAVPTVLLHFKFSLTLLIASQIFLKVADDSGVDAETSGGYSCLL